MAQADHSAVAAKHEPVALGSETKLGHTDDTSASNDSDREQEEEEIDGDYGSYSNHVFSNPKVASYWRGVYDNAQYEGRHRFDPNLTWSASEEKRLKRKACTKAFVK